MSTTVVITTKCDFCGKVISTDDKMNMYAVVPTMSSASGSRGDVSGNVSYTFVSSVPPMDMCRDCFNLR